VCACLYARSSAQRMYGDVCGLCIRVCVCVCAWCLCTCDYGRVFVCQIASPRSRFALAMLRPALTLAAFGFAIDREIDPDSRARSEKRSSVLSTNSQSTQLIIFSIILYTVCSFLLSNAIPVILVTLFRFVFPSCVNLPLKVAGGCTARLSSIRDLNPRRSRRRTCLLALLLRDRIRRIARRRRSGRWIVHPSRLPFIYRVSTFLSPSLLNRYGNIYHGQRSMFALAIAFLVSIVVERNEARREHVRARTRRIFSTIVRARRLRRRRRARLIINRLQGGATQFYRQHLISQPIS